MDKVKENSIRWLSSPRVSEEDKARIRSMSQEELDDAFFKDVELGTAGMRGVLGPGTNRMNEHTVGRVSVAFGQYLLSLGEDTKTRGIVLSHDNRFKSREFALLAAKIFNQMGIKAFIFPSLRPVPELSFAVRYCKAK
ncbi:MAG: phospho-sugar mutase, partial [Candidatus Enteromonas sp.]